MIGRASETALLAGLLEGVPEGRPFVLTVRGDRGAGRSTVLDAARELAVAHGFRTLATRGVEGAEDPGFAGLASLLRPLRAELDGLAPVHQQAIGTALSLGGEPVQALDVHVGALQLLTQAAELTPLLLLIDDADLLDQPSAAVLAFALGRLGIDRVGAVAATGPGPGPFDAVATEVLPLAPMSAAGLAEMIRSHLPCSEPVAATLAGWADGSPLLALELARSLTPEEQSGAAPLPAAPRPTVLVVDRLQRELEALAPEVQRVLAVAALDRTGSAAVVAGALRALGEAGEPLDAAEAAGVLEVDGDALRFRHALVRPLARRLVAAASRRAAHRALASILTEPAQATDRVWHLVASCSGPDEEVAGTLDLVAAAEARRGAPGSAARALEQAARLSATPASRAARLVAAATAQLDGLGFDDAVRLASEATTDGGTEAALVLTEAIEQRDGPAAALAVAPDDGAVRADLLLADGQADAARRALDAGRVESPLAAAVDAHLDPGRSLPAEPLGAGALDRRARRRWLLAGAERGVAPALPGTVDELVAASLAATRNGLEGDARRLAEQAAALVPPTCARLAERVAALSQSVAGATDGLAAVLSAAELRVAEAVATGLTNREAAERLFLSAKTVDFHLQTIYRKLAIRSRAELATLVATRMGPA